MSEEPDVLLPAQRVYAQAVRQAMLDYRAEVNAAESRRKATVEEALKVCLQAMEATA